MRVRVQLFARAKEILGANQVNVELPTPATVALLRRKLAEMEPRLATLVRVSAVAVDTEIAQDEDEVKESSEIALLPPVSGG